MLDFLVSEPIVLSFSAWLAFLWGVMFRTYSARCFLVWHAPTHAYLAH